MIVSTQYTRTEEASRKGAHQMRSKFLPDLDNSARTRSILTHFLTFPIPPHHSVTTSLVFSNTLYIYS
jgi:hypothetical protein